MKFRLFLFSSLDGTEEESAVDPDEYDYADDIPISEIKGEESLNGCYWIPKPIVSTATNPY